MKNLCSVLLVLFFASAFVFAQDVTFSTQFTVQNLYIHDMNGDLGNDVLIGGYNNTVGGFEIHCQKSPPGTFSDIPDIYQQTGSSSGYQATTGADAGDFNGDGLLDVAGGGYYDINRGWVYTQQPGFIFNLSQNLGTSNPQWAEAGDFNGDGRMDISIMEPVSGRLRIWLQQPSGGFPSTATYEVIPSNQWPYFYLREYTIADLNNDNKLDILMSYDERINSGGNVVYTYFTTAIFYQPTSGWPPGGSNIQTDPNLILVRYEFSTSIYSLGIGIGDINNLDGLNDVAVLMNNSYPGGASLLIFPNTGTGISPTPSQTISCSGWGLAHHFKDLNSDGRADVAVGNPVRIFFQTASGTISNFPGFTTSASDIKLAIADMNQDTKNDLVSSPGDLIHIWFGDLSAIKESPFQRNFSQPVLVVNPNPFQNHLVIQYALGSNDRVISSQKSVVSIRIYDATGRLVRDFSQFTNYDLRPAGVLWDGTDELGHKLPSGIYFIRLEVNEFKITEKVTLLK
uniref:T9SS type A sorting domain-containing protein n=1 Tax=candidate division WOR-3 bacterium TaxID=2052148 RepID=A0A7C4XBU0_UNCW3